MTKIIEVRFKDAGRTYYFDPGELEIHEGDGVIVETARGIEFADVVSAPHEVADEMIVAPLKCVERVATEQDFETRRLNKEKEKSAFGICNERILAHGLEMKLVDVEYSFNGSKIIFYFTADGRVDFRELVKDLAGVFKTRIELRQIGVRDEAKMLGGLGPCGRPVCCNSFLADFQPVSIKMAKEQGLSLSPTKISGLCGRLMCCLKYEQDDYESMRKQMPKTGKEIYTPDGPGQVLENNVISETTRVRLTLPDGTVDVRTYPFRDLLKREEAEAAGYPTDHPEEAPRPVRPARPERPERGKKPSEKPAEAAEGESEAPEEEAAEGEAPKEQKRIERRRRPHPNREKQEGKGEATSEKPEAEGEQKNEGEQKREGQHRRRRGGQKHSRVHNPNAAAPEAPQKTE